MTNEQKYATPEERVKAFGEFCNGKGCTNCIIKDRPVGAASCAFHWLALEAEDEKPEPCPFCDGECRTVKNRDEAFVVGCDMCCYTSQDFESKSDAIAAHNRVARAVRAAKEGEVK